ncbi:rhamnogalacturonan acetylesterase [Bacillus solitudinis]|uniref:rhamnogalacturonan acetylesterase n=1 Tax=Bacillus solitudinis TaxID=2014074 RepID=UPI000C23EDD0|nr:rhamnogalacturonan acetylesterase [Bacillus solitudinis]
MNQHYIFGNEKQNYTVINVNTFYNSKRGYGLEMGFPAENTKSVCFRADVIAGEDYLICLKIKGQMTDEQCLLVNDVEIKKDWQQEEDNYFVSYKFAAIEDSLFLDMPVPFEELCELSISLLPKRIASEYPVIFLISDSTVKTYDIDQSPMAGWGQVISRFLKREISVENRAMGGRSTKLSYKEGRLNDLLVDIKPGDYMFIQFAHNDMSREKPERYVTIEQYKDYLNNKYIKGAKQRSAIPVCLTSTNRRTFDDATEIFVDSFPTYTLAMKEVAKENKLTLLELNKKSLAFYNSLGMKNTDPLFMQLRPGEHPNYLEGLDDNTHFREAGAKQMARMVIEEIDEKLPEIRPYTLNPQVILKEVFPDTMNYWARDQVELMARFGFMAGEQDGLFHPEADITVGEFLSALEKLENKISQQRVVNTMKLKLSEGKLLDLYTVTSAAAYLGFPDVNGQFLRNEPKNLIQPDDRLTKGETAAYLYKLYFYLKLKEHASTSKAY